VSLFLQAHLLLHTKYNDPCPRLVVEAMACGLPVVYSATGGVQELVGRQAGVGIPGRCDWRHDYPPDARQMADAVVHVVYRWEAFCRAARRRGVARFDVKPWILRHQAIFQRLMAQKGR
jgi:glycosyltransferase involved in cell wall biosynthesis